MTGARVHQPHVHSPLECGLVLLDGGPFRGQGFWGDEWRALVRERKAFAARPGGRHSRFLDYTLTETFKAGYQLAVYQPPQKGSP